jgi:hypothetical protein
MKQHLETLLRLWAGWCADLDVNEECDRQEHQAIAACMYGIEQLIKNPNTCPSCREHVPDGWLHACD